MFIDVSELLAKKITRKPLDLELNQEKFWDGNEFVEFSKPVYFKGQLKMVGEIIELTGEVQTELLLTCSRCLEKFSYVIDLEVDEKLSKDSKEEEIILIKNDKIDINEIIENNIIVTLPISRLCKPDCKGLCQQCGVNLNESTCICDDHEIDPRLAKLKDLFS